jgi:hypothetical protein
VEDPSLVTKVQTRDTKLFIAHLRLREMEKSTRQGCHLCSLMLHRLNPVQKPTNYQLSNDQIWVALKEFD